MHANAAIIGVGQSAYTRRPQPGQSTHTFIRDAVVAALADAAIDPREVDGMAIASFSLAPDASIDLAWKLGLSLRWLVQDTIQSGQEGHENRYYCRRACAEYRRRCAVRAGGQVRVICAVGPDRGRRRSGPMGVQAADRGRPRRYGRAVR